MIGKHPAKVGIVLFHPNGTQIATSNDHGEIRLWAMNPASQPVLPLQTIAGPGQSLQTLWFDHDGTCLMTSRGGVIYRWDLKAPSEAEPMTWAGSGSGGVFDKDHRWLTLTVNTGIALYRYLPQSFFEFHGDLPNQVSSNVRFMPDGKSWISAFGEDGIRIHSIPGEQQQPVRQLWNDLFWLGDSMDVDPSGRYVSAPTLQKGICIISIQDGRIIELKGLSQDQSYSLASFSPDGKSVAAAGLSGIEVWDLATGVSHNVKQAQTTRFYTIKYSPDGTLFAAGVDGILRRSNLADDSFTVIGSPSSKGIISAIAISKDGRIVATSTWTGKDFENATAELKLYDLQSGKSSIIDSHGNRICSIAFDSTGTKLVTGDYDGVVRVGPITGETPNLLLGHKSAVVDVTVDPFGKWILSSEGGHPIVRLWRMPQDKPLQSLSNSDFQNVIRRMTNVRIVADQSLPGGYRVQLAPFTGWIESSPE